MAIIKNISINIQIPNFDILLKNGMEEMLYFTLEGLNIEYAQFNNTKHALFFVLHDLQIDTLIQGVEYPVLLARDEDKLFGVEANMIESLVQWTNREESIYMSYFGIRCLPITLRIDGLLLSEGTVYYNVFHLCYANYSLFSLKLLLIVPNNLLSRNLILSKKF